MSERLSDEEMTEAMDSIVKWLLGQREWNPCLHGLAVLRDWVPAVDPHKLAEILNSEEMAGRLVNMPDEEWRQAIDRLTPRLRKTFPDAKP